MMWRGLVVALAGLAAVFAWRSRAWLAPALYDLCIAPLDRLGLRRMRRRTVEPAQGVVLEIGVGTGRNFGLYQHVERIIALDPDPGMLARAPQRGVHERRPVDLVQASAESLPFSSATFDTVVGTLVFCTIPDPVVALAEIRRVLKPGGELRLLEHVRLPADWLARTQDAITPIWARLFDGCHPNRDTLHLIQASGFVVPEVRPHLRGLVLEIVARSPA